MLNEALRLIRAYHDISQTQLCSQLGVSNSHLSEIESGKKQPSLELLGKYSDRFDVPLSSLMFFSENLENPGATEKIRVGAARKVVALLQWVEEKNGNKSGSKKIRQKA
jgi:transcriptional regulator with XRE-family HTH domain